MNKILFRADASPSLGTGDLMSLIRLSKKFRESGWENHFMIRDHEAARKLADQYELHPYSVLPHTLSADEEVVTINCYIAEHRISHFFCYVAKPLNQYDGLPPDLSKGCICVYNDGIVPQNWDLVVNWNFPDPGLYPTEKFPRTRFLLGPQFVVLPDNFNHQLIERRSYNRPIKKLMVAMGGADEHNLTTKVVEKICHEDLGLHLVVIVGAGFREQDELRTALQSGNLSYECKTSVTNMFAEYMDCDAAVGTGGLTSSELVATHTPSLLVAAYEHQEARCRFYDQQHMAVYLGTGKEFLSRNFGESLSRLEGFDGDNFTLKFCGAEEIETHFASCA